MSDDETVRFVPRASPWATVPPQSPFTPVRHSYPLVVRDHGLGTAIGLLMRSLPYALARFGILLAYTLACIVWLVVTFGYADFGAVGAGTLLDAEEQLRDAGEVGLEAEDQEVEHHAGVFAEVAGDDGGGRGVVDVGGGRFA